MAIVEVENPRREKSGEEKFGIIVPPGKIAALGNQVVTILEDAYRKATKSGDPFIKVPWDDDITRTALWILTDLTHLLAVSNPKHRLEHQKFVITQQGMATVKHFFSPD